MRSGTDTPIERIDAKSDACPDPAWRPRDPGVAYPSADSSGQTSAFKYPQGESNPCYQRERLTC